MDRIWFRCDSDECDRTARVRVEFNAPSWGLPTPGPCAVCRGPMRLGGRVRLQSNEERMDAAEHEASG